MNHELEYIFPNSTDLGVIKEFAIRILHWDVPMASNVKPSSSSTLHAEDGSSTGIVLIDDQRFNQSFELLK